MKIRSLRVSGHVSSVNRTSTAEDHAEDDFGQWAKDDVTGEQGYVDDERSCFWTWDDTECVRQSRPRAVHPKEAEEQSLAKNKHKILKCGQKRTLLGGTKDAKTRKACQKAMMAFRRMVFAHTSQIKAASKDSSQNKGKRKVPKRKRQGRSSSSIRTFSL